MSGKLISIENLTVSFYYNQETFNAIDNVSFDIYKGQSLGIVGESGSGKSLTALSILNLLPVSASVNSGEIFFFGEDSTPLNLLKAPENTLKTLRGNAVSMIFQEPMTSLNPVYTCGNQVAESILAHKKVKKPDVKNQVLDLFADVKLPAPERIYRSYPHELSGGQRQRVMIAMALSCRPKLLIADEPTTALDVTVQKSILSLLNELKEQYGMSLMFISHDLSVVSEVADNIAVMHQGRIVERNSREEILQNPQEPYTKGLIACRPSLTKKPDRLLTLKDFTEKGTLSESSFQKTDKKIVDQSGKNLIEIKNLSKRFALKRNFFGKIKVSNQALSDINLRVTEGETLGLVGESGSGKSTLGRIILNLLDFDNGEIHYKGKNIQGFKKDEIYSFRQNAQIIFQDPYSSLNPRISIGEMISEPLKFYKYYPNKRDRETRVNELLEQVRLGSAFYNRYPHELSGGQRQRAAIARVLALNPEFIVCDEAVSALDVSVQAEILNLLQDLKAEYNLTYIFISHDFSVIRFMADRVAVMNQGRIVELDEADNLLKSPQNDYTKELLNSIPSGI